MIEHQNRLLNTEVRCFICKRKMKLYKGILRQFKVSFDPFNYVCKKCNKKLEEKEK